MKLNSIPIPTVMPIDRKQWAEQLNLSNFVNTYYQYHDLRLCGDCRRVLIVGPGQGLDVVVLKWRGYEVVTFDIDDTFKPDYLGSVHDLSRFSDKQFDVVIASHVLEHLAVPYLNTALSEIARIAHYALIYLPVHGRHLQLRLIPGFKGLNISFILDLFNYFERPDGITPKYMDNQHFWEIGMKGFRVRDLQERMTAKFEVISSYRNRDWLPSWNFVLKSKYS